MQRTDHSLDLVHRALSKNPNQAFWCRELELARTTLAVARVRGFLTPIVAADLAGLLGEDIEHWSTIAMFDSQPQNAKVNKLRRLVSDQRQQRLGIVESSITSARRASTEL